MRGRLFGSGEQTGSSGVVDAELRAAGDRTRGDGRGCSRSGPAVAMAKRVWKQAAGGGGGMAAGQYPYTKRYLGTLRKTNSARSGCLRGPERCIPQFTEDRVSMRGGGAALALAIMDPVRERDGGVVPDRRRGICSIWKPRRRRQRLFGSRARTRSAFGDSGRPGRTRAVLHEFALLPVGWTDDPFAARVHRSRSSIRYTGGTGFPLSGEPLESARASGTGGRSLTRFRFPYLTITPTFPFARAGYLPASRLVSALRAEGAGEQACEVWTA
jgi:ribonucleoside-triphosphate reductase